MLQLFKNEVVAEVAVKQADVRQRELDYYVSNYWIWCSCSTIIGGFVFEQLTEKIPDSTPYWLSTSYLLVTTGCFGSSLCVIMWTVFLAMWGPGLALRGADGMNSFNIAVDFLKSEQSLVYAWFQRSIGLYFCSSATLVWVFPSRFYVNLFCMGTFAFIAFGVFLMNSMMNARLRGFNIETTEAADGRIRALDALTRVGDLDHESVDHANYQTHLAGAGDSPGQTLSRWLGFDTHNPRAAFGTATKPGKYHPGLYETGYYNRGNLAREGSDEQQTGWFGTQWGASQQTQYQRSHYNAGDSYADVDPVAWDRKPKQPSIWSRMGIIQEEPSSSSQQRRADQTQPFNPKGGGLNLGSANMSSARTPTAVQYQQQQPAFNQGGVSPPGQQGTYNQNSAWA